MNAIVAVSENMGIGFNGGLLFSIPEDMKFFRQMTENKVVVMGRATFESLPGGLPLKNRTNIVLSKNPDFKPDHVTVCCSEPQLLSELKKYDQNDIFIIGGEKVYNSLLKYCSAAYVTKIKSAKPADKYFFDIDNSPEWQIETQSPENEYNGIKYKFYKYKRIKS